MLCPSTAPRWKRHTKTGRQQAATCGNGRYDANAPRARNNGSRPILNSANPPDFTKTRLEIDICFSSKPLPPAAALAAPLLPLELRSAYCEADGQGTRLRGIADAGQLTSEHLLRVLGHRPTQDLLVDHTDQLVGVPSRNDGVERDGHARQLPVQDTRREPRGDKAARRGAPPLAPDGERCRARRRPPAPH